MIPYMIVMYKVSNDQELVYQKRNLDIEAKMETPKLQIDILQREHTFNQMSSSFQKGGHSDILK